MKNLIDSYLVYENHYGIVELVINTSEAFPHYQTTDDYYTYYVGDYPDAQQLVTHRFLDNCQDYVVSEMQEQNKLIFYFIPKKILNKKRQRIFSSLN